MSTQLSLHTTQADGTLFLSFFSPLPSSVSLSFFPPWVLIWICYAPTEEREMEAQEVITRV